MPLKGDRALRVETPVGEVTAEPKGSDVILRLTLAPSVDPDKVLFFYYADGAIRPLQREGQPQG
jgi:hypothetical protein